MNIPGSSSVYPSEEEGHERTMKFAEISIECTAATMEHSLTS